jgi:hypothetical protein
MAHNPSRALFDDVNVSAAARGRSIKYPPLADRLAGRAVSAAAHRDQEIVVAANCTAFTTSAESAQRTIAAGWRSNAPFQM